MTTEKKRVVAFLYVASCLICLTGGRSRSQMGCNYFLSPMHITASPVIGTIRFPHRRGQNYLPNQHCEWVIRSEDPDLIIQVFIKRCEIQGWILHDECSADYLDFYEANESGEQHYLGRFCQGKCQGKLLVTKSPTVMIHFVSDSVFQFGGFELTYMAQPKKEKDAKEYTGTALAVGIPVGLISLTVAIIIIVKFYLRWFAPKRSPNSHPPPDSSFPPSYNNLWENDHENQQQRQRLESISSHPHPHTSTSITTEPPPDRRRLSGSSSGFPSRSDSRNRYSAVVEDNNLPPYSTHNAAALPLQVIIPSELPSSESDSRSRVATRTRISSSSRPSSSALLSMAATTDTTDVSIGDHGGGGGERSETPPPSYEVTMLHDRMLQREGGEVGGVSARNSIIAPLSPPDYDSIVKTNEQQDNSMVESSV